MIFVPNNDNFQLLSEEGRKVTFQDLLPFFSIKKKFTKLCTIAAVSNFVINSNKAKEKQPKPLALSRRKSLVSCFNMQKMHILCLASFSFCYSNIMVYWENCPCLNSFSPPHFRPPGLGIWQYLEAFLSSDLWCSSWCYNWLALWVLPSIKHGDSTSYALKHLSSFQLFA